MKNMKLLLMGVALSFEMSTTVFASTSCDDEQEEYTLAYQLGIALERQKGGVKFDAPLSEQWHGFFNQAVRRVSTFLKDDSVVTGERKEELHEMLDCVNTLGQKKFEAGEMDTHWYLFLNRMMGEILTVVQSDEEGDDADDSNFGGLSYESLEEFAECVEQFSDIMFVRKNHLNAIRQFYGGVYDTGFTNGVSNDPEPWRLKGDNEKVIEVPYSTFEYAFPLLMDCFHLPYIGTAEQVLFPITGLNEAMSHRIALSGFPTEPTAYDGGQYPASARRFGNHDLVDHAESLFAPSAGLLQIKSFNPIHDPLLKIMHPLLQRIQKHANENERLQAEIAFFYGFHEQGVIGFFRSNEITAKAYFDALGTASKTQNITFKEDAFSFPLKSKYAFYKATLLTGDLDIERLAGERPLDDTLFSLNEYEDEVMTLLDDSKTYREAVENDRLAILRDGGDVKPSQFCLYQNVIEFPGVESYATNKNILYDYYGLILEMGLEVPDFWRDVKKNPLDQDSFPHEAVQDYLNNDIAPILLKIQRASR